MGGEYPHKLETLDALIWTSLCGISLNDINYVFAMGEL
jgi:hypothetical protein